MQKYEDNAELKLAEGGAWNSGDLEMKGFTKSSLSNLRKAFRIIYWQDRFGGFHYPKWQFDPKLRVLPPLLEILGILRTHDTLHVISRLIWKDKGRKSLLDKIRAGRGALAVSSLREEEKRNAEFAPPTKTQIGELRRRIKENEDPTRYAIVSTLFPSRPMVYDVASGNYNWGQIRETCLFKERAYAKAVAAAIEGKKNKDTSVIAVTKTAKGYRALETVNSVFGKKKILPKFLPNTTFMPLLVPIATPGTRGHIAEALLFAVDNKAEVLEALATCPNRPAAQRKLTETFKFSQKQSDAALELRLWQNTPGFRATLLEELKEDIL